MVLAPLCSGGWRVRTWAALTSTGLSLQINLLGDGQAYAIVCEPKGITTMDLFASPQLDPVSYHNPHTHTQALTERRDGTSPLVGIFLQPNAMCSGLKRSTPTEYLLFTSGEQLKMMLATQWDDFTV